MEGEKAPTHSVMKCPKCNLDISQIRKSKRPQNLNPLKSTVLPLERISNVSTDIKLLILLTAAFTGMTGYLFAAFLLLMAGWAFALIIGTILDSAEKLDVHRVSRWDSRLRRKDKEHGDG